MGLVRHLVTLFRKAPSKRLFLRSLALGNKDGDRTATSADGTAQPPLRTDHFPDEAAGRVRSLVDGDAALRVMIRDVAGVSDEELQIARSFKPAWKQLFDGARVAPRELEVIRHADWSAEELPVSGIPVLVIRGERVGSPVYPTVEELPRFVADPEIVTIPGQGHLAATMTPHAFAPAVPDFLARH